MRTYKVVRDRYIDGECVEEAKIIEADGWRVTDRGALIFLREIDGTVVDVAAFAENSWDGVMVC